ncbi:MAG: hypothetical protein DPW09_09835 [Anaerolineae bacterium]|nr:hypothetical protein [Anaerolineales bacterium]MCQ3973731.1 hypothetical protein [Anaerolineae bacterium]
MDTTKYPQLKEKPVAEHRTKTHEIYTGVGKIYRNTHEIATVRYELVVVEADQKTIWGQITVLEGEWNFDADNLLILHLIGGRQQFDFVATNSTGSPPTLTYQISSAAGGRGLVRIK